MKLEKLDALEVAFFKNYPDGFDDPEFAVIKKKHKMDKMQDFVLEHFSKESFEDKEGVFENFVKLIGKSSLVSVFEKTKFKGESKGMSVDEKNQLVEGLYDFLYVDQEAGFEKQIDVLNRYKMAKWPILTVLGVYLNPEEEVLVKPTTVKGILKYFEVEDFKYTSKANYGFYKDYRTLINRIKAKAGEQLDIDNAAFCGFLMMTIQK